MAREILIADDEAGFRALFRYMLEPKGFTVVTVDNGAEALEMVRKKDFALVILDVHMPMLTGPQALEAIHKIKPSQPVLILSSSAEPEKVEVIAQKFGATGCFQKPFDTSHILRIIESASQPK